MSAHEDERVTDEVEALEAILLDDVTIKRVDGAARVIETVLHPSTGDDAKLQFVCATLEVTLTPDYPDSSPEVVLRNPRGLDDALLARINAQIRDKLLECLGQPVVFELIELIRENLTESNLPSGQCAICLYGFAAGDAFIKTQCYHHFHSHCLAGHLTAGESNYAEELDKLPLWQRLQAPPYKPTCPVCRSAVACDVETLRQAQPPRDSIAAPPFRLTAELKVFVRPASVPHSWIYMFPVQALQRQMAALLAVQVAKGGTVGVGDIGPPPLTITTASDNQDNDSASNSPGGSRESGAGKDVLSNGTRQNGQQSAEQPQPPSTYRGPYRGFNRRNMSRRGNGRGRAGGSQPCASSPR